MSALSAVAGGVRDSTRASTVPVRLSGHDLSHRYSSRVGLERVSFELQSPGFIAVTGANGAGKSTLLRIVAGLLRPSQGRSVLDVAGREIPPAERRHAIGFAAPTLSFYEEMSVRENLRFAGEARGLAAPDAAVRASLERVGLETRADDRVSALSSGLLQRLRLAFALLAQPPVLLLDEPGSHLDESGHERLATILREESTRALVVLATNDPREWTLAEQRIELRGRGLGHSS